MQRAGRCAAAVFALAFALPSSSLAAGAKTKPLDVTFRVAVHVATERGSPVRDDAWIDAEIAAAERLFGPVGVHFARAPGAPLPERFAHVETREDRDALASRLDDGAISVMLTGSLRDVDDPTRMRQGVHWRPKAAPRKHYVVLSAVAGPTTLAHELGHYFGNGHTAIVDNLMSYARSSDAVFLTEGQKKTTAAFAGLYLSSKQLVPVPKPGS